MRETAARPQPSPPAATSAERPGKALGIGFERSLHPMLIVDAERRYVDANAAAELFFRLPRAEIVKHGVDEFVPPERQADLPRRWQEAKTSGGSASEGAFYFPADNTRIPIVFGTTEISAGLHLIVLLPWAAAAEEAEEALAEDLGRRPGGSRLTDREREVLTLLALGHTGEEVAEELFISPETVRTHVQHVRSKLGASNRGHAIALALTRGEISTESLGSSKQR